jgi:hypothetical protein
MPAGETPMVPIQQAFMLPGGDSQPTLGDRSASDLVKNDGMLLEEHDHIAEHLSDKAPHQIDQEGERTDRFRSAVAIDPDQWFRLIPITDSR